MSYLLCDSITLGTLAHTCDIKSALYSRSLSRAQVILVHLPSNGMVRVHGTKLLLLLLVGTLND